MVTKSLQSSYSKEAAQEILSAINSKGWNCYNSTNSSRDGRDEIIRTQLAIALEPKNRYVLLPKVSDPTNPSEVMDKLEAIAVRTNRKTPTITISGSSYPWTGFRLEDDHVKVNTQSGHYLSYPEFIRSLDSIMQV